MPRTAKQRRRRAKWHRDNCAHVSLGKERKKEVMKTCWELGVGLSELFQTMWDLYGEDTAVHIIAQHNRRMEELEP